ncbi:regulatory protein RecX [Aliikangiella maris]|uniref:Regulatory protein RecX n=2 Tax=Aliikangiella maris TaxID=3162458 RepID=A0ABV2BVL3_9GAMM
MAFDDSAQSGEELPLSDNVINKGIGYACRLLGIREYSVKSIAEKIKQKGYSAKHTQQIVTFLLENNWLSDERFCEAYLRSKSTKGIGEIRIRYELKQQGLSDELINETIDTLQIEWQQHCDSAMKKKLSTGLALNSLSDKQKIERFLRYRGYSGEQIKVSMHHFKNKLSD